MKYIYLRTGNAYKNGCWAAIYILKDWNEEDHYTSGYMVGKQTFNGDDGKDGWSLHDDSLYTPITMKIYNIPFSPLKIVP